MWHMLLKAGQTSADNIDSIEISQTCTNPQNVREIQQLFCKNQYLIIQELCEAVAVGSGTCWKILTEELGMHPHLPQDPHSWVQFVDVCTELQRLVSEDGTSSRVITGEDEAGRMFWHHWGHSDGNCKWCITTSSEQTFRECSGSGRSAGTGGIHVQGNYLKSYGGQ